MRFTISFLISMLYCGGVVANESLPILSSLLGIDQSLRAKLILAFDDTLEIGNSETFRGQTLTNHNVEVIDMYRALGVPESEVVEKVERRLHAFFEKGRELGLSQAGAQCLLALTSAAPAIPAEISGPVKHQDSPFLSKHDLSPYRKLRNRLGSFDPLLNKVGYYDIGLRHAFEMASMIGNTNYSIEALLHILRFANYETASEIADDSRDDRALMTIGYLALVDFFDGSLRYSNFNVLSEVIDAFKRVQGPLKSQANQIMYDLALEVTSDEFLKKKPVERGTYISLALLLLTATADGGKVRDSRVVSAIRDVLERFVGQVRPHDVRDALAAIDGVDELNRIAEETFAHRATPRPDESGRKYIRALGQFSLAGNIEGMKRALEAIFTETAGYFTTSQIRYDVVPAVRKLFGPRGFEKVFALVEREAARGVGLHGRAHYMELKECLELAIQENNFVGFTRENVKSKDLDTQPQGVQVLLQVYEHLSERIKEVRASSQEALVLAKSSAAQRLARGDAQGAYEAALEALDRDGIIAAGDLMVKTKTAFTRATHTSLHMLLAECRANRTKVRLLNLKPHPSSSK